jgi:plastocyanin
MRALTLTLLLSGAVAACGGGSSEQTDEPPPPVDLRGQQQVIILAKDNFFEPAGVIVEPGTEVTWVNEGAIAHNVRKSADAVDFGAPFGVDTGQFPPGGRYTFTFAGAGSYPYTCTIHTFMDGQVIVEEASPSTSSVSSSTTGG